MKIGISSTGEANDSRLDSRFGRCAYFVIYNSDTEVFTSISNSSREAISGAGINAAQVLVDKGVDVVITGNVGPNAFRALDSGDIDIYLASGGTVQQVITEFENDNLQQIESPSVRGGAGQRGGGGSGGNSRGGQGNSPGK